jgi:5-formyltetrahydrofolate cyclo-ligase
MAMVTQQLTLLQELKRAIREQAHAQRTQQEDKDRLSGVICQKFAALPEYAAAKTVMFYLDVRSEVRTRHYLPTALGHGKRIVIPYCVQGELELFWLTSMDELSVGMYRILEPRPELRGLPEKQVDVKELDLVMVPGVAFDRSGARMGHGKGYYDKLLEHARPDTPLVALAFECQLFPEIPTQTHDVFMDKIITEREIYCGKGRLPSDPAS